ncbi:hypothetical protein [Ectobacillus sp. sgz5001026]|uniref:hypothetical protein n=1 Tax=Ectobacillus sp. sgz5001026 TaxID=3242473 RepID=UPI0036D32B84
MKFLLVITITGLLLSGCSADIQTSRTQQKPIDSIETVNTTGITATQFASIKEGMSYDEVKQLLGSEGDIINESGEKGTPTYKVDYAWPGKTSRTMGRVTFLDGKVRSTFQNGLQ